MTKVAVIGAGSVIFSINLIRDFCVMPGLQGTTLALMDIDADRLQAIHALASRYVAETGARLHLEKTTRRREALEGSRFVINTVKVGGYAGMEAEREMAERHGYHRGVDDRVSDYYGGFFAYHQLAFFLDLAREVEAVCPDAWYLQVANPVLEGTTLVGRETGVRAVGFCHGANEVHEIMRALGLDPGEVDFQVAGLNHAIFLTRFRYRGQDAYPLLDEWVRTRAQAHWESPAYRYDPWATQLSRAAVEMYRLYGLFPIGDTVRNVSPWWWHRDAEAKRRYFPAGGPDSEVGWTFHLHRLQRGLETIRAAAADPTRSLTREFPPRPSGEAMVPFIDAVVNGRPARLVLDVPNEGAIPGLPRDVFVEVPVTVCGDRLQREPIEPLPARLMLHALLPRWLRMERVLQAFRENDRTALFLTLMDDPRTDTPEQAERLMAEILDAPWNADLKRHYRAG